MAVHDESATHLTSADRRSEILADPGFGRYFTDHMIRSDYRDGAWSAIQILPYEPLSLDPSVSCLHYGQLIFEGLKAFRQPDNSNRNPSARLQRRPFRQVGEAHGHAAPVRRVIHRLALRAG